MEQEFFTHLPTEIMTDILSRLPVRSIVSSKCVCKSWLHLLKTDEFVNSHLAKSVPMLAALMPKRDSSLCTVFEFEDKLDLEGHDLHYIPLTIVDFPHGATIQGSATFGFGASKLTGQYKVVQITTDSMNARYECHVHTLGTESWRSIEPVAPFKYGLFIFGVFLNGSVSTGKYQIQMALHGFLALILKQSSSAASASGACLLWRITCVCVITRREMNLLSG